MPTSAPPEAALSEAVEGRATARILGVPADLVDLAGAVHRLVRFVEDRREHTERPPALVVTLNPEMVMLARRDLGFARLLEQAAMLVPDGIGVVRALRRRGFDVPERVGGIELMEAYLPVAARRAHGLALAGGGPGVAAAAARRLSARYPGLRVVAAEGGDPDARLGSRLAAASPEVVCAAFGHGRQERFLYERLPAIGAAAGVGVGGWLDYVAGTARRAPAAVRDAGLEWAWRLAHQPWRLRRQLVLPLFWALERREAALLRGVQGRS